VKILAQSLARIHSANGVSEDYSPQVGLAPAIPAGASATASRCIIYIVRRTQLYLDDHLWNALHARARSRKTTVSELVREAVRERYLGRRDEQMKAMQAFVGTREERSEPVDAVEYARRLRRSGRLDRLHKR
jgi:hypothetical protein